MGPRFSALGGCEPGTEYTSNTIKTPYSGSFTITGGTFSLNGGSFVSSATGTSGDTLQLRATSSLSYESTVAVVVSIGMVETYTWSLVTGSDVVTYSRSSTYNRDDVFDRDAIIVD